MAVKKILITGASGFIGSFLCEKAGNLGYEVWAGVRNTSSRKYLNIKGLNFIELSFEDKILLSEQLSEYLKSNSPFDYIIHNAGVTKSPKKENYFQSNYLNTKNFIEVLSEMSIIPEKFIFTSSLAAFGPASESSPDIIKLDQKPVPVNLYGKSKLMAEEYIRSVEGLNYIILRPTGVYGPRDKDYFQLFNIINRGFEVYIGTLKQKLTFIYLDDLVNAYFLALSSDKSKTSFFVSESKWYYTCDFYAKIKKELNKRTIRVVIPLWLIRPLAAINDYIGRMTGNYPTLNNDKLAILKAKNWYCETSQLEKELNFKTEYDLDSGIKATIKWYRENGWLN